MIRLIATDLDNTLLRADRTVSDRTVAALDAARAAGVLVVPVTARNPVGLRAVNGRTGFGDWALCGNGAYGVHLASDRVLYSVEASTAALTSVTRAVLRTLPDVRFAAVRELGQRFIAEDGYAELASAADHSRDPASMERADIGEITAAPALKLVFRHAAVPAGDLFATVGGAVRQIEGVAVTMSGALFVEVMAAGVSKAAGLERLCAHLGVARHEVLALGDGLNDVDMLQWAGHGVAVANAIPDALAAADEVTGHADEDGAAAAIERAVRSVRALRAVAADSPRPS